MRMLLTLALMTLLALPANARELTPAESESLGKAVDGYLAAIGKGDAEKIVGALPPRMLNVFAGATGVEADKLTDTLVAQTKELTKGTNFRDLSADRSNLNAEAAELTGGGTVTWVLLPTVFTTEAKGETTRHQQPLLALHEGGSWYFLRIEGPQSQQLVSIAYPFLAEVTFPPASASAVK